ncbi:hypothetical protein MHYP_G00139650 [Metynnis hypsauchen]
MALQHPQGGYPGAEHSKVSSCSHCRLSQGPSSLTPHFPYTAPPAVPPSDARLFNPSLVSIALRTWILQEVSEGFMIGPFTSPPFSTYHVNPFGVATHKYSGKKHLIINLSAPHGSSEPSINSFMPSSDFSLHYATVDYAISWPA